MENAYNFIEKINNKIDGFVEELEYVYAKDLGLDERAGYQLYIDSQRSCIIVSKSNDRNLQYYGGFEYVDKDSRIEMGDWVFYFDEDSRVQECFEHLKAID